MARTMTYKSGGSYEVDTVREIRREKNGELYINNIFVGTIENDGALHIPGEGYVGRIKDDGKNLTFMGSHGKTLKDILIEKRIL